MHPAAINTPAASIFSEFAKKPVNAGNAPHPNANQRSLWKRPPASSRL
jgi:hypothetical protein